MVIKDLLYIYLMYFKQDYIYHYIFGVLILTGGILAIAYASVAYAQCDVNTKCNTQANEEKYGCNYFLPAGVSYQIIFSFEIF